MGVGVLVMAVGLEERGEIGERAMLLNRLAFVVFLFLATLDDLYEVENEINYILKIIFFKFILKIVYIKCIQILNQV